jgi:hypothetical protein
VNAAWLTAMLTATGTNAPKSFPKSPDHLLAKTKPQRPMSPRQWEAMIKHLTGGNRKKTKSPKDSPRDP